MKKKGINITLPPVEIPMGMGTVGCAGYIEVPDKTTIEFSEVCSIAWMKPATYMRLAMPLMRMYDRIF